MFADLTDYLWILWLALVVIFVVIELVTLEFTFLMLAAGSLLGGLGANLVGLPWWAQIGAAAVFSALLIFLIRPLLLVTLRKGGDPAKSNIDALYGLGGRVMGDFTEDGGLVKLDNGETWTARWSTATDSPPPRDRDRVTVARIDGAIAEVGPAPTNSDSTPSITDPSITDPTTTDKGNNNA